MVKKRAVFSRLPRGVLPWMIVSALFFIGAATSVVSILGVPKEELARAVAQGQHLTIDPASGKITGLIKVEEEVPDALDEASEESPEHPHDHAHEEPSPPEPAKSSDAKHEPAAVPKPDAAPPATQATAPTEKPTVETPASTEKPEAHPPAPAKESASPASEAESAAPPVVIDSKGASAAPKLATTMAQGDIPEIRVSSESIVAPGAVEITEKINGQAIPKRSEHGLVASTLYAKNFAPNPELSQISIVLTDAGFNAHAMAAILKLPRTVTIAFSPYAPSAQPTIAKLHAAGFETWGMLPSMSANYPKSDPGPLGLIASLPPEEVIRRLRAVMSNTLGAVGLVLLADETLSQHPKVYSPVIEEITNRGLWVLSTHPTRTLDALTGGNKKFITAIRRADIIIDTNASASEIQSKLRSLKDLAQTKQRLIVVMPARLLIVEQLADWLSHNGLGTTAEVVPLSFIYKAPKVVEEIKEEKSGGHGEAKKEEPDSHGKKSSEKNAAH